MYVMRNNNRHDGFQNISKEMGKVRRWKRAFRTESEGGLHA